MSILNQSWQDFELIIIDDGSSDRSSMIVEALCRIDHRIVIVTQSQKGQSAARNCGLKVARGAYIYFFDSDDLLQPNALEICFHYAKNDQLDLVTFSGTAFDSLSHSVVESTEFKKPNILNPMNGQDLFVELSKRRSFSVSCCLYFFSRSLIESASLKFDEGFVHEDEAFTTILYCSARRAIALEAHLFSRRIRVGSTMTKARGLVNVAGCLKAVSSIAEYLTKNGKNISFECQKILRHRQKTVLRQATINAFLCGASFRLLHMVINNFRGTEILRIDPLFIPFFFWCFMQRRLNCLSSNNV